MGLPILRPPKTPLKHNRDFCDWQTWFAMGTWSFDLPRRVMRDVHRSIATGASQRRHRYAGEWLTPGDPLVLAGAAGDDVSATTHLRLRLVRVASVKGRENLVTVAVRQHAGAVNV